MITEILPTLQIHKLTQEQYDRELEAGRINENALYLTPSMSQSVPVLASGTDLNTVRSIGEYYLDPNNTYTNSLVTGIPAILRVEPGYSSGDVRHVIEWTNEKFERVFTGGSWEQWKSTQIGGSEGLLVIPIDAGYAVIQWGRTSMSIAPNTVSSIQINLPYAYANKYDYEIFSHVYNKRPEAINYGCYDQNVGNFKVYCNSTLTGNNTGTIAWMTIGVMNNDPRYTI